MDRLQQASIILVIVILTGYAWSVGWLTSDPSGRVATESYLDPQAARSSVRNDVQSEIPRPLLKQKKWINVRPLAKTGRPSVSPTHFRTMSGSQSSTPNEADQTAASILGDLPKLEFELAMERLATRPNKLIKAFPGSITSSGLAPNPTTDTSATSPTIEPQRPIQTASVNSNRYTSQRNLAPRVNQNASNRRPVAQPSLSPMIRLSPAIVTAYFQKVRYANSLARRGAVASAKTELEDALMILVEAQDQAAQSQVHSQAIQQAWMALKEVDDFRSSHQDVALFIAGHETQALAGVDQRSITRSQARAAYFSFAEKRFLVALGNLSIASEALRSLGKVYAISEKFAPDQTALGKTKSLVMFRLATAINGADAIAARELGVLYASYNRLPEAKSLLIKGLRYQRDEATWANLAKVHQALGEHQLAQQALNEARLCAAQNQRTQMIQWTHPQQFQNVRSMVDPPLMTRDPRTANRTGAVNQPRGRR